MEDGIAWALADLMYKVTLDRQRVPRTPEQEPSQAERATAGRFFKYLFQRILYHRQRDGRHRRK